MANPFSDLSVSISAQTGDFTRGINNAQESLGDLQTTGGTASSAMQVLQNRINETKDELTSLGRSATVTSGQLTGLSAAVQGATTSFSGLSTITMGSLVPAIATLSTVLAPVAATFGGIAAATGSLAAAFGAVLGSGALAFGQQLSKNYQKRLEQVEAQIQKLEKLEATQEGLTQQQQKRLEQLKAEQRQLESTDSAYGALAHRFSQVKKEITPLIADFGKQFIPLIERTVEVLPDLVESIINAIGPTESFTNGLLELGSLARAVIPDFVGTVFELAREALPTFIEVVADVVDIAGPALEGIMQTTRAMTPMLVDLGSAILDLLPKLNEFGQTVAEIVTPAVTEFFESIENILTTVNNMAEATRDFAISMTTLAPAITFIAAKLAVINPILGLLAGAVGTLAVAFKTNFMGIQGVVGDVVSNLQDRFNTFKSNVLIPFRDGFVAAFNGRINRVLSEFGETADMVFGNASNALESLLPNFTSLGIEAGIAANKLQQLLIDLNNIAQGDVSVSFDTNISEPVQNVINSLQNLSQVARDSLRTYGRIGQRVFGQIVGIARDNKQAFQEFGRAATNAFAGVIDVIAVLERASLGAIQRVLLPAVSKIIGAFGSQLGPTLREITETIRVLMPAFREAGGVISNVWAKIGDEVTASLQFIADAIAGISVGVVKTLGRLVRGLLNLIQGDFSAAFANFKQIVVGPLKGIENFIKKWGLVERYKNLYKGIINATTTFATTTLPGILIGNLIKLTGQARTVLTELFNSFASTFNGIAQEVANVMTAMVNDSVVAPINNAIGRIQNLIGQLPKQTLSQLPKELRNLSQIRDVTAPDVGQPIKPRATSSALEQTQIAQDIEASIGIEIQGGDSQLAQIIRENAEIVVEGQARRADRTRQRGDGI